MFQDICSRMVTIKLVPMTMEDEDEEDGDYLEEMLRVTGSVVILKSAKGLENLERVEKTAKESLYGVKKGCLTHWTVLCFVLELLILKAKYNWLDCSFNNLFRLLSWLLPQPNSIPANTNPNIVFLQWPEHNYISNKPLGDDDLLELVGDL